MRNRLLGRRAHIARPVLLLAVTLVLGACATTAPQAPRSRPAAAGLYGVADGRLLTIGNTPSVNVPPQRDQQDTAAKIPDVSAMAYDPKARRLYAIADASSKPRLMAIDQTTGEATMIGLIEAPDLDITIADALAIDPQTGTLYAAGGDSRFASNVLLTLDPTTGKAQPVAEIRGTIQDEVDAMAFVDDKLYAIDGAGQSSALYLIDPATGEASRVGKPFARTVTDLTFDVARRQLFGAQGGTGPLLVISLDDGSVVEMPATPVNPTAVAIIPVAGGTSLFGDGFESGNATAWSGKAKKEER